MGVLVSVIVPAYNVAPYLEECVNSILASTFQDYELLLIDDGSTDETGAICDALAERSNKIRVFHTENGGVCAARNLGIDNAVGECINFVDGDDIISPRMLERLATEMKPDIQLVSCRFTQCKRTDERLESSQVGSACIADQADAAHKLLIGGFGGNVWNKLYRKSILDQHSIRFRTEIKVAEDQFFTMDYLPYCEQSAFLDESMYYYMMNNGSIMNSFRSQDRVSEKYVGLPRAWAYSATVVAQYKDLSILARKNAVISYQSVLRKLKPENADFKEEAIAYARKNNHLLLRHIYDIPYYISGCILCMSYSLWRYLFSRSTEWANSPVLKQILKR